MRLKVLGGGWYGCHIAAALLKEGHDVELHEISNRLFSGASGGNPARLHLGFHYPRSKLTRAFCQEHHAAFIGKYGHLTRHVPINIYAVAAADSLVDFGTYKQILRGELEFVTVHDPAEHGLQNVEGAFLTGERHIVIDKARTHFEKALTGIVRYNMPECAASLPFDYTIDCTFCSLEGAGVDRYEPCITALLQGPTNKAVTIMDGPFPSLYPWDEDLGLNSLTSALFTPFSKTCRSWQAARDILDGLDINDVNERTEALIRQMVHYWPSIRDEYIVVDHRLTIRAMPRSGADARLVDVVRVNPKTLRVRAGKIDAVIHAVGLIKEMLP